MIKNLVNQKLNQEEAVDLFQELEKGCKELKTQHIFYLNKMRELSKNYGLATSTSIDCLSGLDDIEKP